MQVSCGQSLRNHSPSLKEVRALAKHAHAGDPAASNLCRIG
jgi:hypothetical protein